MNKEQMVEVLNNLALQALRHGADPGGPYNINKEPFRAAFQNAIEYFGLDGYCVSECDVKCDDGDWPGIWPCLQVIKV